MEEMMAGGDYESTPDPLLRAILAKDEKAAISFIQRAPDVNYGDVIGRTPIHYAALKGFTEIVDLLVQKGANIEMREKRDGMSTLYIAATYDHKDFVEKLLKHGADVNTRGPNTRLLCFGRPLTTTWRWLKFLFNTELT